MSAAAPLRTAAPQTKVITCPCVISYPVLWKPRAVKPGDPEMYGATFIFNLATDRPCLQQIRDAAFFAGREKWRDFDAMLKANRVRVPWRKGEERADQAGYGPGKIFINCRGNEAPGVVDMNVQPIMDTKEIYAGCIVKASITAFAYDQKGNKGVSFGLNNVQKVKDGERIDNRSTPSQDFTPLGSDDTFGGGSTTDDMFS